MQGRDPTPNFLLFGFTSYKRKKKEKRKYFSEKTKKMKKQIKSEFLNPLPDEKVHLTVRREEGKRASERADGSFDCLGEEEGGGGRGEEGGGAGRGRGASE